MQYEMLGLIQKIKSLSVTEVYKSNLLTYLLIDRDLEYDRDEQIFLACIYRVLHIATGCKNTRFNFYYFFFSKCVYVHNIACFLIVNLQCLALLYLYHFSSLTALLAFVLIQSQLLHSFNHSC